MKGFLSRLGVSVVITSWIVSLCLLVVKDITVESIGDSSIDLFITLYSSLPFFFTLGWLVAVWLKWLKTGELRAVWFVKEED